MFANFARCWKRLMALLGCTAICLNALAQAPPPNAGVPPQQVAVDPSVYDGYVGHYKMSDTAVLTVSRNGTGLSIQPTGQGPLEIFPSSKSEYFSKIAPIRITFVTDAQGHATALILHQGDQALTVQRIDDQTAKQIEDALNARMQSKTPSPGTEAAIRRLFAGLLAGKPNYDEMAPQFADVTRQQLPQLQAAAQTLGPIQSVQFRGVSAQGADTFEVQHEHGTSNIGIMLSADGKIQGAMFSVPPPAGAAGPKAEQGPYRATSEAAFDAVGFKVFRPDSLDQLAQHDRLPVVVWGNGGCTFDAPVYTDFLSTIASHGFLVITTAGQPKDGAALRAVTVNDLKAAIDWARRENARAGSPLQGRIETKRVAVMGQSCGGGLAIEMGADPRVTTIGVFNYGSADDIVKLHGPVLLINGHTSDFMMAPSKAMFEAIAGLPVFYGARHGVGHIGTMSQPGGGEFATVASNWALWQLRGDKKASEMFIGPKCGLCTNSDWDAQSKRLSN